MNVGSKEIFSEQQVPYDYAIDWLESDGNQWIDTHIIPAVNMKFDSKVAMTNYTNTIFWGVRQSGDSASYNSQVYLNANPSFDINAISLFSTSTSSNLNWKLRIASLKTNTMYEMKDMTLVSSLNNFTYPIHMFGFNALGSHTSMTSVCACRISYLKIHDGNSIYASFIPVRKDGIGYMYDEVSGKLFKNSGQGAFILGPDKK